MKCRETERKKERAFILCFVLDFFKHVLIFNFSHKNGSEANK